MYSYVYIIIIIIIVIIIMIIIIIDEDIHRTIPIKCLVSHCRVSCDASSMLGRSNRHKKKEWTLEGVWVLEKARLLSNKDWLQSQLRNVFLFIIPCLFQKEIQFVFQITFAY